MQCRDAYREWLAEQKADDRLVGVRSPGWFYDPYNIPAELLFRALHKKVNDRIAVRAEFDSKLLNMVYNNAEYDRRSLVIKPQHQQNKTFTIYFQIYFLSKSTKTDLFKTQLTLSGIKFTWCSERDFWRIVNKVGDIREYRWRRSKVFPKLDNESNTYTVKAKVANRNMEAAVNKATRTFQGLMDCINVVQAFNHQERNLLYGPSSNKTAISSVGIFIAERDDKAEIFWSTTRRCALPSKKLNALDTDKKGLLRVLLRAFQNNNSAAADRLRCVVMEFASALDAEDVNLSLLGFWRCLEITTRKANGQTRRETEVLDIFKNYIPGERYWEQQGLLIRETRNIYVHRGVSGAESPPDYYLNWSKQYAEASIRILIWLYNNRATWRSDDDIDIFFDHYSQSNRKLELAEKILRGRSVPVA